MNVSNVTYAQNAWSIQGNNQHHRQSLSEAISTMQSRIDDAVDKGKLPDDLADAMKKVLDALAELLKKGQTGQGAQATNSEAQLSNDDRFHVKFQLREIGKQLFSALNPSDSTPSPTGQVDNLFKAVDANSDNKIDKGEFSKYLSSQTNSSGGLTGTNAIYTQQASFSMAISVTQRSFSAIA
jgi:hypothetical protein